METNAHLDIIAHDERHAAEINEKLHAFGSTKWFSEGDVILDENAYIRSIPIVLKGGLRVFRTDDDGRELLLYYLQPGETCIMSFLGGIHGDTSKVRAVTEDNTEILFVPIDKIHLLNQEYPEWLQYIFRLYHKRFEELLSVINDVAFKKMDERLLDFIQRKCALNHSNSIAITHEMIANELGTARVVVSRLLKAMEEKGLVTLGRNKIVLLADPKNG